MSFKAWLNQLKTQSFITLTTSITPIKDTNISILEFSLYVLIFPSNLASYNLGHFS